jgi:hypothetical protein
MGRLPKKEAAKKAKKAKVEKGKPHILLSHKSTCLRIRQKTIDYL